MSRCLSALLATRHVSFGSGGATVVRNVLRELHHVLQDVDGDAPAEHETHTEAT